MLSVADFGHPVSTTMCIFCACSDARDIDCERCEEVVKEQAGYKHIYHEV